MILWKPDDRRYKHPCCTPSSPRSVSPAEEEGGGGGGGGEGGGQSSSSCLAAPLNLLLHPPWNELLLWLMSHEYHSPAFLYGGKSKNLPCPLFPSPFKSQSSLSVHTSHFCRLLAASPSVLQGNVAFDWTLTGLVMRRLKTPPPLLLFSYS